jgi:uncharacterized protein (TIGR03118 family)
MNTRHTFLRSAYSLSLFGLALMLGSCSSSTSNPPATPKITTYFTQTNLVSDIAVTPASAHIDTNLVNAWGIAFSTSAGAHPWISANGTFSSTVYDTNGGSPSLFTIPAPGGTTGGAPSGVVYNTTAGFGGNHFIFCTEDGVIAGWSGGSGAKIVSDSSGNGAVFKGLALVASANQLYATDFHNNVIVVYDNNFNVVNHFTDASVPAGYGPFGIQNINDTLYVTYARQKVGMHDDSAGASIGYIDRFTPGGVMIGGHFTSGGNLNSPWGIALAPSTSAWGNAGNAILIGNFGDGRITAYDHNGNLLGQLASSSGNTISIDGLWGISFNPSAGADPNKLYFTAGPAGESHGLFGYLYP